MLAAPERVDHVEIIDVDEGETVLYWDLLPRDAKRVVTMLRADLETMEAREFFERWASFEGDADLPLARAPRPPSLRGGSRPERRGDGVDGQRGARHEPERSHWRRASARDGATLR